MASDPSEETVANFVSFTSTTREQAISFLKANGNDSQKAINAYFEDPTGPQTKTSGYFQDSSIPSFDFHQQDNAPPVPATAPPSRPPSRVNMQEVGQDAGFQGPTESATQGTAAGSGPGLSLAELEEQELQQAVAMSLNQGMGEQETGVTTAGQPHFGKATQDHYDEGAWAMTLFNTSTQEVVISPDPEDRRKVEDEPAFIRPTQDNLYLGGFLTILHSIPLAREALLLRNKALFDYGHDQQWWNGQAINLPKIVTVHEAREEDSEWDDIIHETQRLMAFLDYTKRAFGSGDVLANLKSMSSVSSDSEEIVTRFLEAWHGAALRADPESPLRTIFSSLALKEPLPDEHDESESKELFTLEPCVQADHGQTLYDVLDYTLWPDKAGEDLDDVWLEHVADVLVVKLDAPSGTHSVDVKIPAVFYPDRYLNDCREVAREFRTKRLQIHEDVSKLQRLIDRYTTPRAKTGNLNVKELVEKAAAAVPLALPKRTLSGADENTVSSEAASTDADRLASELRAISTKIEAKLKELEQRKQSAVEALRSCSKTLTEPTDSPDEPPHQMYTLRGVCTEPQVTYVLKRNTGNNTSGAMDVNDKGENYQWWRLSFSAEDGKTRQAKKRAAQGDNVASQHGDVVGYTARKVREIEVLRAAREEWRSVLLVYASEDAMNAEMDPAPPQLQGFVEKDNEAFAAECEQSASNPEVNNKLEDLGSQQKSPVGPQDSSRRNQLVNVFDYEVTDFNDENEPKQEMQEKARSNLLGAGSAAANTQPNASAGDSVWKGEEQDETMMDHVEHV